MTSGFVHEHDGSRPAVNGAPPILPPASGSFFDSPQRRRKYPAGIVIAAGRPDLSMALTSPAFADTDSPGILRNLCSTSSDPSLFSHSYAQQLKREHFQRDAAQAYTSYAHTEPGTSTSTHFGSDMTWDTSSSQLPVATSILSSSGRIIAQRSASTPAVTPQPHDAYWDVAQNGNQQPHSSTSYRPHRIWEDQRESSADAHAPDPSLRPGSLADFPRHSHWGGDAFTEGRGIQARRGMSPYLTKSYQDSRMMSPRIAHPRLFVDGSGSTASREELDRQGIRHMDSLPPILTMDQLQNQLRMRQASNQSRRASVATAKMDDLPADDWDVPSRLASAAAAPMLELHPREETFAPSSFGSPLLSSRRTYPPDPPGSPAFARRSRAPSYGPSLVNSDLPSNLVRTPQTDRLDGCGLPMYTEDDEDGAGLIETNDKRSRGSKTPRRSPSGGFPSDDSAGEQRDASAKRTGKLPAATTAHLKGWLMEHVHHPYPTEDEKRGMCLHTNLNMSQVSNWFINARRRILPSLGRVTISGNRKQVQVVGESAPPRLNAIGARLPPTRASATAARLHGQAYASDLPSSPPPASFLPPSSPSYAHYPQAFYPDPREVHTPYLHSSLGTLPQDPPAEGRSQSLISSNTRRLSA